MKLDNTHLRSKCLPIIPGRHQTDTLMEMLRVMHDSNGIGIAANQVGLDMAAFIAATSEGLLFVGNPQLDILHHENEPVTTTTQEGCLSLPGKSYEVTRYYRVRLRGVNPITAAKIDQEFVGYDARIIQHECDHLNGIAIDTK